jgi:hypothetical protein
MHFVESIAAGPNIMRSSLAFSWFSECVVPSFARPLGLRPGDLDAAEARFRGGHQQTALQISWRSTEMVLFVSTAEPRLSPAKSRKF